MKQVLFISLLILAGTICSCQKIDLTEDSGKEQEAEKTGELYVTCTFSQKQTDVVDTRANTPINEIAQRITYIAARDGKIVQTTEQINGGGTVFGTMSLSLPAGVYRLMVFAHNEDDSMILQDNCEAMLTSVHPTGDCFSYSGEFEVKADSRKTASCKLTRAISQLTIQSDDEIEDNVSSMLLALSGVSLQYDLANSIGCDATELKLYLERDDFVTSDGTFSFCCYNFLPAAKAELSAVLLFYDSSNNLLMTKQLEGIQAAVNTQTIVTTSLHNGVDLQNVSAETDWEEDITQTLISVKP